MIMKRSLVTLVALAAVVTLSLPALADHYMKQVTHTDAMEFMGQKQPERFDTTSVWIGDGWARSDTGDTLSVLYNIEKGELYVLRHIDKQYAIVPLDMDALMEEAMGEADAEEAAAAKEAMNAMMGSASCTVTPTDETKKFGDWEARKYNVKTSIMMMNLDQEMWASEDIEIDADLFHALNSGLMTMMPGADAILKEMVKIEGVPVYSKTVVNIMGTAVNTSSELVEYEEKDAPEGAFEIPEGYTKVDASSMMGGM